MEREYKRIQTKAELKEWLAVETARYPNSGKYRLMNLLMLGDNAVLRRHQVLLRKTEYYINSGHKILASLYKMHLLQFQIKYGMHVPPNTFGRGLRLMHVGEIHVNDRVRGGEDCCLHVNTSMVAGGFNDAVPRLGDGVLVFIGAVICGDADIASNVVIGANSVVNRSIQEENVTVSGNPAQIVSHKGRLDMGKNKEVH